MGKKVGKKARGSAKEKAIVTHSPKKVTEMCNPTVESVGEGGSVAKETNSCPHLVKGVNLDSLSAKIESSGTIRCEDCREGAADRRGGKGKGKHGKKKGGALDSKAIWVCMECGRYTCGGVGLPVTPHCHVVGHARKNRHSLVINFEKPQLCWCFPCNMLIQVDKIEKSDETNHPISDVVKLLKARSSEKSHVNNEDISIGDGSVTSEIKSGSLFTNDSYGHGGYVVRGLVNLGNTCYFNSVMQNLLALNTFRENILKLDAPVWPLVSSLKKLFTDTNPESGLKNIINPRSFFGCVCSKSPQFRGYQQHDSHELLRCLLDGLSTEEIAGRKQNGSPKRDRTSSNTLVDALFGGQISSTVCCIECGHFSTVYEPFLDLSLPVPTKKPPPRKAPQVPRNKKAKLPLKKGGKPRVKVNKDADPLPVQNLSNQLSSHESSCPDQSVISVAGEMVASSSDSTVLGSEEISSVANKEDLSSPNLPTVGDTLDTHVLDNGAKKTSDSSDDFAWLDYLEAETMVDECGSTVLGSEEISSVTNKEGSSSPNLPTVGESQHTHVLDNGAKKTSDSSDDLAWLDYVEAETMVEECASISPKEDVLEIQDNESKDECLNKSPEQASYETSGPVCFSQEEPNLRPEFSSASGWEDDVLLQVQSSEVLLLPYKEESSSAGEIIGRDGGASSSVLGAGQQEPEFDGFGDLFSEPEVVAGPAPRPSSSSDMGPGSVFGNISESDPEEVDDTDSPVSVESCLAHFIKPELLSDENAWHCENCSEILQRKKKEAKEKARTGSNGNETGSHNESRRASNCCSVTVRSTENGDIKNEKNVEGLVSHVNHDTCLENGQTDELNLAVNERDSVASKIRDTNNDEESGNNAAADSGIIGTVRGDPPMCDDNNDSKECSEKEIDLKCVKVKRDATKRVLIYKAPPVLTIHLKRFSQDARGRLSKLNGHVNFRETIDLRPYMDPRYFVTLLNSYLKFEQFIILPNASTSSKLSLISYISRVSSPVCFFSKC